MNSKILVTAVKAGGGHIAAMNSIIDSLQNQNSYQLESYISNNTVLNKVHEFFNFKLPLLYDIGYNLAEFKAVRISQDLLIQDILEQFEEEFEPFFHDTNIEKIISTHFLTTQALLDVKERLNSKVKIIGYVPDYDTSLAHFPYSSADYLDGVIAQSYSFINRVANEFNFPRSKMQKAGFVTSSNFQKASNIEVEDTFKVFKNSIPELQNISKEKLRIVIAGGSGWTGTISSKVKKLCKALKPRFEDIQIIVVSGSNSESIKKYSKLKNDCKGLDLIILPKLEHENLSLIYRIADLVLLASIAPASLFELMQSNTAPLILVKSNPGQEFYNKNFALEEGLIEISNSQSNLDSRVLELINTPSELKRTKRLYQENYKKQLEIAEFNAKNMADFIVGI